LADGFGFKETGEGIDRQQSSQAPFRDPASDHVLFRRIVSRQHLNKLAAPIAVPLAVLVKGVLYRAEEMIFVAEFKISHRRT